MSNWTEADLAAHYARLKQPQEAHSAPPCDASEAFIQQECVRLLQQDGWRSLRTDPVSSKSRGKGFGELGMADYLFIRYAVTRAPAQAEVLWVEFKSRKGAPQKHQTEWHNKERARGALTWISSVDFLASVDGFRAYYQQSGLMRRKRWW